MGTQKNGHSRAEAATKQKTNGSNIAKDSGSCTCIAHVERDAKAMVAVLNQIRGGMESYEVIYDSLRRLHGPSFDQYFRDALVQKER